MRSVEPPRPGVTLVPNEPGADRSGIVVKAAPDPVAQTLVIKLPAKAPARGTLRNKEFLASKLEHEDTPASPISLPFIILITVGLFAAFIWSYFGWLDVHVAAQGSIRPSSRSKIIQPLEPGRVASIFIENGARVNKGDPLIELDPVDTWADLEAKARDLEVSKAEVARRRAAIAGARAGEFRPGPIAFDPETNPKIRQREEDVLVADLAQLASSQASLEAQLREKVAMKERLTASIEARAKLIAVGKERVAVREALKNHSGGSRAYVIEAAQQLETQMVSDANDRGQLIETIAAIQTLKHKIEEGAAKFIADQSQKLSDEERKQNQELKDVVNARSKFDRTRLVSPIAGTVQQLTVTTIGQVVTSGESLMMIVPLDTPIEVEAFIKNKDIGFIEPDQPAAVKIDAFPFTRYGTVEGTVTMVSRSAVDNRDSSTSNAAERSQRDNSSKSPGEYLVYPAIVTLAQSWIGINNKQIPLSPGMGVTVEIKVKPRRVIDYVLSPLRELVFHSAHER